MDTDDMINSNGIIVGSYPLNYQTLNEWIAKVEERLARIEKPKDKREKLRLLLEGGDGFYRKYYNEIRNGSVNSMDDVINRTLNKIFKLFDEKENE